MKKLNTSSPPRLVALLFGAALLGLVSQSALAAGTASNTTISNLAKLSYSVSGTAQSAICSAPGAGNSTGDNDGTCVSGAFGALNTDFLVDNKVNLTVARVSHLTTVPGTTKQALVFTVTNNGNTAQSYALTATAGAENMTVDMSNVAIYKDTVANGIWDGGDTLYVDATTFGSVAADASLSILIVADTSVGALNGETAIFDLKATTTDTGTVNVTAQTAGGDTGGVDVVFADIATSGTDASDIARDGEHSTNATYTVGSSIISVAKTVTLLCDPYNGVTNPKNIPGAIVQYSITISNGAGAGAAATLTTIADALDTAKLTLDQGAAAALTTPTNAATCVAGAGTKAFKVTVGASRVLGGSAAGAGTVSYFTYASDADGVEFATPNITATFATILPIDGGTGHASAGLLNAGETVSVIFNTLVQ